MWSPRTVAVGLLTCLIVAPTDARRSRRRARLRPSSCSRTASRWSRAKSPLASPASTSSTRCPSRSTAPTPSRLRRGRVEILVQMHDVNVSVADVQPGNLQDDLAGKKVTVHFKGDKQRPVVGTMIKLQAGERGRGRPPTGPVRGSANRQGAGVHRGVRGRDGRGRGGRRHGQAVPPAVAPHPRGGGQARDQGNNPVPDPRAGLGTQLQDRHH